MIITANISEVRSLRWQDPTQNWGLVATMGYLHEGHLSLVRRAKADNERVAVTIFVNPLQFAPTEDLATYPRNLTNDLALLEAAGVDLVFTPDDGLMYPAGYQTYVTVNDISKPLEGTSRPAHFQGVATIVAKLFNIIQPNRVYFGQKDAQQTLVLRRMVDDLNFNLEFIICPTVREGDGLAMSSRNSKLTPAQRAAAPVVYQALLAGRAAWQAGEQNGVALRQVILETITAEPLARPDYVSVADLTTLSELTTISNGALLSLALFFGPVRLIDNLIIE